MSRDRVKVGIPGLDDMLGGGLIPGSITSIIGTFGTGKTTFSLEFVWEGLKKNEKIIYISLEEREERIISYMKLKGWDVTPYLNKSLFVIKLDPTDFNLANNRIKNELPKLIEEIQANRVVIDPISLFEDLFTSDSERRREMYRFIEGLRDRNCTIMMTSETDRNNPFSQPPRPDRIPLGHGHPPPLCPPLGNIGGRPPCTGSRENEDVCPFPGDQTLRPEAGPG